MAECLLQLNKTHVDWFCKLPWTLKCPVEGIELVQFFTIRTKSIIFLLNPEFNYRANYLLEFPGVGLPRESKCDPTVAGTHPLFWEKKHHHQNPCCGWRWILSVCLNLPHKLQLLLPSARPCAYRQSLESEDLVTGSLPQKPSKHITMAPHELSLG